MNDPSPWPPCTKCGSRERSNKDEECAYCHTQVPEPAKRMTLKITPQEEREEYGYIWSDHVRRFVPNSPLGSGSQSIERHRKAQELTLLVHQMMLTSDLEFEPQ